MTNNTSIALLSGSIHPDLSANISKVLDIPLTKAQVGRFPDGEIDVKVNDDIRARDVFILAPTCPPVHDALVGLLTLVGCCPRSAVDRVTAVIPYFGYARKDRKDEGRVPITAKMVANCLTAAGVDRVLTMDLHAAQIQGFFDVPVDHLYAQPVFQAAFSGMDVDGTIVIAPDAGGIKMARAYASSLGMRFAIVDKRRMGPDQVESEHLIGSVDGKDAIIIDDLISTAGTICDAARMIRDHGARKVMIAATHGLFCGPALERIQQAELDSVYVTDSVKPLSDYPPVIKILSVAPLLAEAILRIHEDRSISSLFVD